MNRFFASAGITLNRATAHPPRGIARGFLLATLTCIAAACVTARAEPVHHGIAAGMLNVTQVFGIDDNTNANVTLAFSINNFQIGTFNRADYNIRIHSGSLAAEDAKLGVLMTSVTENGRNNFGSNGYPTSAFDVNAAGAYRISTFLATSGGAGSAIEYNVNVAGAWFPFDRYLGGYAFNSTRANGGTNDVFVGSPGLVHGTHFRGVTTGRSVVDLRSLGIDSRLHGILLVTHAKDENNFALSQVNTTDGTWNVFVKDNATPTATSYEQDPVAFVFIPKTNTSLVSGRFIGNGNITAFSGTTPQFTVTNLGTGRWDLRITGGSPTNGILIISPEGGGSLNSDNIVSYQVNPAGTGWEIQSRDTPLNGLETPGTEPVVSFVYIPAPTPGFAVTPTNHLVTMAGGGQATFTVALDAPPTSDVFINLASSAPSKGIPSPATLKFKPSTWHVPETVTITGQNDSGATGTAPYSIILSPAVSLDSRYHGLTPNNVSALFVPVNAAELSPANNTSQTGISPILSVPIIYPESGNLTVTFHGREAPTNHPGSDFSILALPDTQYYAAERFGGRKEMFIAQTEWAITNRIARNIAYVTHLGDIVDSGDIKSGLPNLTEWRNVTNALYRLENPTRTQLPHGIPYGLAVGNHDQEPIGNPAGTTTFYNQYFGVSRFLGRPYYAGHYGTNNNNHFDFFNAGGLDFIALYFEYDTGANPAVLAWANDVLRTNAHRRAIIVTHYMANTQTPCNFGPQGAAIYDALKGNTNIFLMLGGHITGQGARQDTYNGNTIRTLVADYQGWANGGNGFMRLMEFSPSNNVVVVQTFSPWTGEILTDEHSEFYFEYDMQPHRAPFTALATNTAVSAGGTATALWPNLQRNKAYEWFVTISDGAQTVTSPTWQFTTAQTNSPPVAAHLNFAILPGAATNLALSATDTNNDPLTFQIHTPPASGLLQNFDPGAGTFTYAPAHGFHGEDSLLYRASDGQAISLLAMVTLNVLPPGDTNNNGLPDDWEAKFGIIDPHGDDDGDGHSNLQEYLANTNPTNAASALRITSATRDSQGHVTLVWPSVGGTRYRVQYSEATNGSLSGSFIDIVRPLTLEMDPAPYAEPSTQTFVDDFTLTGNAPPTPRYYRVKVVQ